jgi:hypothetical protein
MRQDDLIKNLHDEKLLSGLDRLILSERKNQAVQLRYFAEIEERLLYASEGFPSMHAFLVSKGLSESSAFKRIQVARAARKFPSIFGLVENNKVSLTVIMKLAPYLTKDNGLQLLSFSEGKTVREVESKLSSLFPKKEKPDEIKELSDSSLSFYFTADREFADLLKAAKAALSHRHPQGKLRDIFGEALKVLLLEENKKHTSKRMPSNLNSTSRKVPIRVKEEVWIRDGGACSFVSEGGRRCGAKQFLEWDHVYPWALGGRSDDPENIRLLCSAHNKLMATQAYGIDFISKKITEKEKGHLVEGKRNRFLLGVFASGGLKKYREVMNR